MRNLAALFFVFAGLAAAIYVGCWQLMLGGTRDVILAARAGVEHNHVELLIGIAKIAWSLPATWFLAWYGLYLSRHIARD